MKNFLLVLVLLSSSLALLAQDGTLAGKVIDKESGEEMIGAAIYIPSIQNGTTTDLSGQYNIKLKPGIYKVEYSYVTYQKHVVEDVEIRPGEVTVIDISMEPTTEQLEEVVVSATRIDNDEVSLLVLQKKSLSIQDGISSQEINRIGYNNSAESMKQVTGASVEGGKFIVMRGLGDRYSLSSVDGVVLPSANPYRNSAGLDLIPSIMVDNIVVKKTFTPDLPGNFTGGAVDISTKSLPDQFYLQVGASFGYNDQSTFNENYKRDKLKSKTDWLGFDDGVRELPSVLEDNRIIQNPTNYVQVINSNPDGNQDLIEEYSETMTAFSDRSYNYETLQAGINRRFSINTGNRIDMGNHKLGYNLGLNYGRSYEHYDSREITNYTARIDPIDRMQLFQRNRGTESQDNTSIAGILALAYQLLDNHEFGISYIYSNDANSSVFDMAGAYPGALSTGARFENRVISYIQRDLGNLQVKGKHQLGSIGINWAGNYILSSQYEPDIRFIGTDVLDGTYGFDNAEYPLPFHFFRELEDTQYNGKLDVEIPLSDNKIKIKVGTSFLRKERDFNEKRYQINIQTLPYDQYTSPAEANGDFDLFFARENSGIIGYEENGDPIYGNSLTDQTTLRNSYTGSEQVVAAYAMGVFNITDNLKTILGARLEKTDYEIQSSDPQIDPGEIDELNILPSLNLIYELSENSNLRASYSKTLARPNMREMAPFSSFDLLGGFPILGNPSIKQTDINNFDLRYEIFPRPGELVAFSAFYKDFTNPIVLELDANSDQPRYQFVNTKKGYLMGLELEFRKGLEFISPALRNFKFSSNLSYIYSRVDLSEEEYEIRKQLDPDLKDWRPFPAQSPYLANIVISYDSESNGWEGAIGANVFGPRLFANGAQAAPDIYEINGYLRDEENSRITGRTPVPELNFRIKKNITEQFSVAFSINNILDYSVVRYQEHNDVYFTNEAWNPGRTYGLSLNYSIF